MLLFEGGLFLISLLTFIVLLIKEIKNSSPCASGYYYFLLKI
ncbi:hypothetical protein [Clostridium tyrobutyricum]